jgi:hypothetical protein
MSTARLRAVRVTDGPQPLAVAYLPSTEKA